MYYRKLYGEEMQAETKKLFRTITTIAVPMMIQNGVSNAVSLLDNLMIGQVGTNEVSGVAISNQLIFIFYLVIFGATTGVGIFTAQYHGKGDTEGVRISFRFKLVANFVLTLICIGVFFLFSEQLISLFLKGEGEIEDVEQTLAIGMKYMKISLIGLVPLGIANAYSGTLRDIGKTGIPMASSIAAIFVNLIGNALLIFGLCGCPRLGAAGAAVATVISRFVELLILVIYTGTHPEKIPFIRGAFRHFKVPGKTAFQFTLRSLPLLLNESLWAIGITFLNQSYSLRSLSAVTAISIESTIYNVFMVAFVAMGEAVGIVIGHILGSGEVEKARRSAPKLIGLTVFCGLVSGILLAVVSPFFPGVYNTTDDIKHLATMIILIYGLVMPIYSFTHASYFVIRAGGNTFITFLFDSCFVWLVSVPAAYILSRFTEIPLLPMIAMVQSLEIIKALIGGLMVRSGIWAKNIVK
ncbi:MAG: MATE family efflux transporter [Clostridiales bacterium]|nr:MATE family efflux transporter [Clostridiales bacterium]